MEIFIYKGEEWHDVSVRTAVCYIMIYQLCFLFVYRTTYHESYFTLIRVNFSNCVLCVMHLIKDLFGITIYCYRTDFAQTFNPTLAKTCSRHIARLLQYLWHLSKLGHFIALSRNVITAFFFTKINKSIVWEKQKKNWNKKIDKSYICNGLSS